MSDHYERRARDILAGACGENCPNWRNTIAGIAQALRGAANEYSAANEYVEGATGALSVFSDEEIAREHYWRMLQKLGSPLGCVGMPASDAPQVRTK